jgi:hypothetical protein
MLNTLGLLLGSGSDSYKETRKQSKDEAAQEWLRKLQERQQLLAEAVEGRAKERYEFEKGNLWDREAERADLQNKGLQLDYNFNVDANPYRLKGLELQNTGQDLQNQTSEFNLNNILPLRQNAMEIDNEANKYKLNYTLPEQAKGLKLGNLLSQKNLNWYDKTKKTELENMYSLMEARKGKSENESFNGTGPFIPKNAQEQKELIVNLRKMIDRYDTAGTLLSELEEYAPELMLVIGQDNYYDLLDEVQAKGQNNPEQYFGRNPIPGNHVGAYLQKLGLIDRLRNPSVK